MKAEDLFKLEPHRHYTKLIISVAVLTVLLFLLQILPQRIFQASFSKPITGTITYLDEYQRYIEIKNVGNDSRVWRVSIKGVPITKKNLTGVVAQGALSDLRLGNAVEIKTFDSVLNKDNDTIVPSMITVIH